MAEYILCIETATEVCSVALALDGQCIIKRELSEGYKHSSGLTPLIQDTLDSCDLRPSDLSAVSISDGPGSYTGLRVGTSTAKAICYSQDIPLIAVSTLKALAYDFINKQPISSTHVVMPTIDARRMEVYTSMYDHQLQQIEPIDNIIYDDNLLNSLSRKYIEHSIIICGHGAQKLQDAEIAVPTNITIYPTACDAQSMCELSSQLYDSKVFVDTPSYTPYYHKAPNIAVSKSKVV